MEKWDLYDENRIVIGEHVRGDELPDNGYHLVVHVWIKNNKNQFLISRRAENRPTFPLMWECVGGSVLTGESSLQGAIREVKEEIGIDFDKKDGKLLFSKVRKIINNKKYNDILDVWLFEFNGDFDLKNATTDEVECCKWLNINQIKDLYNDKKLVPSLEYIFDSKFD